MSESDNPEVVTPLRTPVNTSRPPYSGRPTPVFLPEPRSFSTKKERGYVPVCPPPKPQAKTCPPVSRVFKRRPEITSAQSVTFLNQDQVECFESVQGTPLPSSNVYDSAKKASYFEQAFAIETKIGAGCFGNVYRVKSKEDGKLYAVKIAREVYRGQTDRALKLEEVRKHQVLLPHSNCVHFYQSWEEKGRLYQQFELCEGNLTELCERQHDLPESLIWFYLVDLLLAVEHIHDHGLIHMDIKPENIFMGREGICKLGDFGLVIDLAKDDINHAVEGDPRYLASEILESRKFTKAADIFSLGVTILELACDLDLPKHGPLWHTLREDGPDPTITGKLSQDLRRVIQLMMTNYPDRRPTVKQLLALPSVQKALARRHRQLAYQSVINTTKTVFSPLIALMIFTWTWIFLLPFLKIKSIINEWLRFQAPYGTPPNTTGAVSWSGLSADEDDFRHPAPPAVSSTNRMANFYIGDMAPLATNSSNLFSSDDEDDDCRTMNRNLDRSTSSSSQHSVLARPLTLHFSDDDDFDGHSEAYLVEDAATEPGECPVQLQSCPPVTPKVSSSTVLEISRQPRSSGRAKSSGYKNSVETSGYMSTPVSIRNGHSNPMILTDSDGASPVTDRLNEVNSSFNTQFENLCNNSRQQNNDLIDEPGTPRAKKQSTPSSVRFRSRKNCSIHESPSNYTSPKKRLNFDSLTDTATDASNTPQRSRQGEYKRGSSTPKKRVSETSSTSVTPKLRTKGSFSSNSNKSNSESPFKKAAHKMSFCRSPKASSYKAQNSDAVKSKPFTDSRLGAFSETDSDV